MEAKQGVRCPITGVTNNCELPQECWESKITKYGSSERVAKCPEAVSTAPSAIKKKKKFVKRQRILIVKTRYLHRCPDNFRLQNLSMRSAPASIRQSNTNKIRYLRVFRIVTGHAERTNTKAAFLSLPPLR